MPGETRIVAPGTSDRTVKADNGEVLNVPASWELLPPGDAMLTRRVKAAGPSWTVKQKKGRRTISVGIWAPAANIAAARQAVLLEKSKPSYTKRLQAGAERRQKEHAKYVVEFRQNVLEFLNFHATHAAIAARLAAAVTEHATPVGSGTVARTKRIPVEQRAEAAVIAWLRHQTTAYDNMKIERKKGRRREVRGELAAASRKLLNRYRRGEEVLSSCPLYNALKADPA